MKIETDLMTDVTVARFQRMMPVVDFNPPYQREGGVWKERTKAILIDSIINGLDVPKLYFEVVMERVKGPAGLSYQYAVIDGKQRLEAIAQFYTDDLRLDSDFKYFRDESVAAGGMTFSQLQKSYPSLARHFLDYTLPIVLVKTDTDDLIDEMFQRLNAASSINAAERRNSVPGHARESTNEIANHPALVRCLHIRNSRYKYRELASKFLAVEYQFCSYNKILDTKANTLYEMFVATRDTPYRITVEEMRRYQAAVEQTLDQMGRVFVEDDVLLKSVGTIVVYYIAFRDPEFVQNVNREMLSTFEERRREASRMDDRSPSYSDPANVRLREYNSKVQSTNDGGALMRRAEILKRFVRGYSCYDPLAGLREVLPEDPHDSEEDQEV